MRNAVLGMFLALAFLLTVVTGSINRVLKFDEIAESVVDAAYLAEMSESLRIDLTARALYRGIEAEKILDAVDSETLRTESVKYVASLLDAIVYQSELAEATFDSRVFYPVLTEHFAQFDLSEAEQAQLVKETALEFSGIIGGRIQVLQTSIIELLPSLGPRIYNLVRIGNFFPACVVLTALIAAWIFIANRKLIHRGVHTASVGILVPSALIAIPLFAFRLSHVMDRLLLAESLVKTLAENLLQAGVSVVLWLTVPWLLVATAGMILYLLMHAGIIRIRLKRKSWVDPDLNVQVYDWSQSK